MRQEETFSGRPKAVGDLLDQAIEKYNTAIRLADDFSYPYNNLGYALGLQGNYAEAREMYRKALSLDNNNAGTYSSWGYILGLQGKYQEADEKFRLALAVAPKEAGIHNNLGLALLRQKRFADALEEFSTAVELDRGHEEAYFNRAIALHSPDRLDEALEQYNLAIRTNPNLSTAYFNAATIDGFVKSYLCRTDGLREKLDILGVVSETVIWQYIWYGESSFQIYNDVDRAFYESITIHQQQNRTADAIAAYRLAIQRNPDYIEACDNLALLLADRSEYDEAILLFQKVSDLDSGKLGQSAAGQIALCLRRQKGPRIPEPGTATPLPPSSFLFQPLRCSHLPSILLSLKYRHVGDNIGTSKSKNQSDC